MTFDDLRSPLAWLECTSDVPIGAALQQYDQWWKAEGRQISGAIDRAGTPWLRMFDREGKRVDEILFAPDYWRMLRKGYESGVVWRAFEAQSLAPAYRLMYLSSFYDPGLSCPYTVSLATAVPLSKYADEPVRSRFLPQMLRRDDSVWQGATWMTEIKGGSDLGANVETIATRAGDAWRLTGDKYFASNVGAELAVVAARPEHAPQNVRGLALFLLPRRRANGDLNYFVRRLKDKIATRSVPTGEVELRDSEAYLLGPANWGIYLILEVLNVSRVANSVGSVALAQRAIADALDFAERRKAFGKRIIDQPLMRKQFDERTAALRGASALAWEAVRLLDEIWQQPPPYSERYHLFRLVAHLAKYWTAEFAVQTAKWAMEVHGGLGTLQEYSCERWLREAMILAIWEGTAHRQMLDGLEVIERKQAHRLLFDELGANAPELEKRVAEYLSSPGPEREAEAEPLFRALALFTASALQERWQHGCKAAV